MKTPPRWIVARLRDAEACRHRMPWERGLRRAAMIARRKTSPAAAPVPVPAASGARRRTGS
ncbi:hypothetical protein [Pseudoroseicyclus tamaricis]|uniref:Uncharacterized protein n=1 Tax=Pseudoroseicyclus tamaricis TaxID=2705421 RepID=A0A6B2JTU7_9RHOB|nr:hypothetical protein [Pseudoroseicyclus tamaricis]NDV01977.1 hypothetical protein [Pseudoroseicyclus tamaricis]